MGKILTPIEALNQLGIFRLAARIYDLKQAGWPITNFRLRTDNGVIVGHYYLSADKERWPESQ